MEKGKRRVERMFSRKDLRRLLVPLMIEQALAMTIGMADTVMVASCNTRPSYVYLTSISTAAARLAVLLYDKNR